MYGALMSSNCLLSTTTTARGPGCRGALFVLLSLALPMAQRTDTGKLAVLIVSCLKMFNAWSLFFPFLEFAVPQISTMEVEANVLHKHQDMCVCVHSRVCAA